MPEKPAPEELVREEVPDREVVREPEPGVVRVRARGRARDQEKAMAVGGEPAVGPGKEAVRGKVEVRML